VGFCADSKEERRRERKRDRQPPSRTEEKGKKAKNIRGNAASNLAENRQVPVTVKVQRSKKGQK
jgi:hypothetical protein